MVDDWRSQSWWARKPWYSQWAEADLAEYKCPEDQQWPEPWDSQWAEAANAAEDHQQWPAPGHAQYESVNNGQHSTTVVEASAMPALNSEAPPSEAASSEAPPLPKAPPVSPMPTWARSAPGPATTEGSAEAWPFSEAPPPEASPTRLLSPRLLHRQRHHQLTILSELSCSLLH